MIGSWFRGAGPIGLDIGARTIKAVQCRASGGEQRVVASARIDRAEPHRAISAGEAARAAGILQRQGFTGSRCVIAADQGTLLSAAMDLPPRASGAPVEMLAAGELARANKCDATALRVAVWDLPAQTVGGKPGPTSMAVGARMADIEATLAALESAGFDIEAIDIHSLALARACRQGVSPAGVVLDVGASGVLLAAVVDGVVVFRRHLPENGLGAVIAAIGAALGVDDESALAIVAEQGSRGGEAWQGLDDAAAALDQHADALAREVRLSLSYISQRFAVLGACDSMLATGGGAVFPGLPVRLGKALGTTVKPFESPLLSGAPEADRPALAVALGLALPAERAQP